MDNNFFDKHADFYGDVKPHPHDDYFIDFINTTKKRESKLLDVGGGSGTFAQLVKDNCLNIDVTVVDPSKNLLDKISDEHITKIYGSLPDQIFLDSDFDYIHVKEVLHHVTGSSIDETKKLLRESLFTLKDILKKEGFLFVHELFYESYLIPTLSRTSIFNLLLLQNKFGIKIPAKEFLAGLDVCFYGRSEFKSILNDCGFKIIGSYEEYWDNTFKKKLLFLENWGRMLFIVKKVL